MGITRRNFLQILAMALIIPKPSFAKDSPRNIFIPVLMYHDVSYDVVDEYSLPPRIFASQMEWLYQNGYRAISFSDLEKDKLPERAVIITFDDGYASFIPYAFPFLEMYGFKATINIIGQYTGAYLSEKFYRTTISWDEYRYLASTGLVSLGCHMDRLHNLEHRGALGASSDRLLEDLSRFQTEITKQIGKPSDIIAWPYGLYDGNSIAIAQKAGFRYMLTSNPGIYQRSGNTMEIPRIHIMSTDKLLQFRAKIGVK